jgi:hypothetical protein
MFSSGGADVGNAFFVGIGGTTNQEPKNQQVVGVGGTFTKLTCAVNSNPAPAGGLVFTLRVNAANTTLTCTVPAGANVGTGTGSVTLNAGDKVDVAAPASMPGGTQATFVLSP